MERLVSEHGRFFAEIAMDEYPPSPREWDNVGTMLYREHQHYNLGDQPLPDNWKELVKDKVWIPYYAYIHSDITISAAPFHDQWDSACAGIIYADRERTKQVFSLTTDEEILDALRNEIETYAAYLEGDVYSTTIYQVPDGADPETVNPDDCILLDTEWHQYNYRDYVLPTAKQALADYEATTPRQLSLLEDLQ